MSKEVCFRIRAPARELDRLVAELRSLGTLGIEERRECQTGELWCASRWAHARVLQSSRRSSSVSSKR